MRETPREKTPREYTEDEVRREFIKFINERIRQTGGRSPATREKLEGLAHTILVAIDGGVLGLPKFILAPDPHPDDKKYNIGQGQNYYPENREAGVKCNISGSLHDDYGRIAMEEDF